MCTHLLQATLRTTVRKPELALILNSSEHHFGILGIHFGGYGFPNTPEKSLGSIFDDFRDSGSLGLGVDLKTFPKIIAKMWQNCRKKWGLLRMLNCLTDAFTMFQDMF